MLIAILAQRARVIFSAVEMSLHLVDVNSSNVSVTWPLLLQAISKADFISLDLELSGLGKVTGRLMEEHYQGLCAVAASRAILSVGVACFIWSGDETEDATPTSIPLTVEAFNVWLLCQRPFTTDPSSAQFLVQHGFDFNKLFSQGLPYTPPSERKTTPTHTSGPPNYLESLFSLLLHGHTPLVVHNGWLDLLFLYHAAYGSLPLSSTPLLADLSEMLPSGVYDTKAMANFKFYEDASFLEYLFRNSQRNNLLSSNKGEWHIVLRPQTYDYTHFYEVVDVAPPLPLPSEQLMAMEVCRSFANYGFCHALECSKSHDVMIIIEQKEHSDKVQRSRLKRKRKRKASEVNSNHGDREALPNSDVIDMSTLFKKELSAAKTHFAQTTPTPPRQPSFGHRAGFDAFMTGFVFGCYALRADPSPSLKRVDLEGLAEVRNCLIRKATSSRIPLRVVKSHFTKNSSTHQVARERLKAVRDKIRLNHKV